MKPKDPDTAALPHVHASAFTLEGIHTLVTHYFGYPVALTPVSPSEWAVTHGKTDMPRVHVTRQRGTFIFRTKPAA